MQTAAIKSRSSKDDGVTVSKVYTQKKGFVFKPEQDFLPDSQYESLSSLFYKRFFCCWSNQSVGAALTWLPGSKM